MTKNICTFIVNNNVTNQFTFNTKGKNTAEIIPVRIYFFVCGNNFKNIYRKINITVKVIIICKTYYVSFAFFI